MIEIFWKIQIKRYFGWHLWQIQRWIYTEKFFSQVQIQINLGLPKIGKYEYKYDYFEWYLRIQIQIRVNRILKEKEKKKRKKGYESFKSMQIILDKYEYKYILVDKNGWIQIKIFFGWKKGQWNYKYIWIDKKEWIWIQIFGLVFANTKKNICHTLVQCSAVQCSEVQCSAVQCCAVLCSAE